MTNDCSSAFSLLLLVLSITDWTNAATLHFPLHSFEPEHNFSVVTNEYQQSVNSNFQLPLIKRLRRWSTHGNDDEVEVPLDEPLVSANSSLSSVETTESSSLVTEGSNSSTDTFPLNTTTIEIEADDNTTINYPLLRQDLTELNRTEDHTSSTSLEDLPAKTNQSDFSSTSVDILITDGNTTTNNALSESTTEHSVTLSAELESTLHPVISNQTTQPEELVTSDSLVNYTIPSTNVTVDQHVGAFFNDVSTVLPTNESLNNSEISQKDAIILIDSEGSSINETSFDLTDVFQTSTDSSNLSSEVVTVPTCDAACHCAKECLYGFELLNDTCLCNPPCENYPCFGNDTCILTDEGHPFCAPANGTEHDRPTRCYQPRDAGYHDVDMRYHNRWYYHSDQDTCHLFVYRGLGGNENNFLTLQECHLECITCAPSPDQGECLGHIDMWYYDNKKNECREFEYSGCKGNDNKFLRKDQCVQTCVNRTLNSQ